MALYHYVVRHSGMRHFTTPPLKHVMIVNDDSSIVSNWSFKLIDDARVIIYDRNRFIIQATGEAWQEQTL
jgi:hypothetical protein